MKTLTKPKTKTMKPTDKNFVPAVDKSHSSGNVQPIAQAIAQAVAAMDTKTTVAKATYIQHDVPATVSPLLLEILKMPRGHNTSGDRLFRKWLETKLPQGSWVLGGQEDDAFCVVLPTATNGKSTTLFSCHIDTVEGEVAGLKSLNYDPNFGLIGLDDKSVGGCLGADDGVGVWIMMEMIAAKVPGCYLFHTGEEVSGRGSRAMLRVKPDLLKQYKIAVAFDRPRDNEVITHQGGQRCASDKFGQALCDALNRHGLDYAISTKGVFTDTKIYRNVIAECTNIGVGYTDQHGRKESLDYAHAFALMEACKKVNWEVLPVARDPLEFDDLFDSPFSTGAKWGYTPPKSKSTPPKVSPIAPPKAVETQPDAYDELRSCTLADLIDYADSDPESMARDVVDLLVEIGRLRSDVALYKTLAGV